MDYKYARVIDAQGYYKTLVLLLFTPRMDGGGEWVVQSYTLEDGERLVETQQPTMRVHAGTDGLVSPRWDGENWIEGATAKELAAWEAEHPAPDLETLRAAKLSELSATCNTAIVAGCDVTLTDGSAGHFALQNTDQINLSAAVSATQQGAAGYPYHADGQLCRLFSAADILAVANAAMAHKLYHTTYCNHLLTWARRAETADELAGIVYGAALPDDLAGNMEEVLRLAQVAGKGGHA